MPAIPDEGEVPVNLEDCSWHMIHQLVQADTFKNYYKVGDTKSVTLSSGEVVYMQVASINDGSGDVGTWYPKGTVDFISKDCLKTSYALHPNSYIEWANSNLRATLNNTIITTLPTDLQNIITEKIVKSSGQAGLAENLDKLWLPTEYEVFGTRNGAVRDDEKAYNKLYGIFTDNNSRIKRLGINGDTTAWRTCSVMNSNGYCGVHFSGLTFTSTNYKTVDAAIGVPICFRVG